MTREARALPKATLANEGSETFPLWVSCKVSIKIPSGKAQARGYVVIITSFILLQGAYDYYVLNGSLKTVKLPQNSDNFNYPQAIIFHDMPSPGIFHSI